MRFYLGTHLPSWLGETHTPLFVSDVRLRGRRTFPRALGRWALDSGAFSQLVAEGGWPSGAASAYAARIRRYLNEVGGLDWAAPQDWMCEPFMLTRTGLTVLDHLHRTVDNYCELAGYGLPIVPVIQGYTPADYLACIDLYARAGIVLARCERAGVGTICRRQGTRAAVDILSLLHDRLPQTQLHCFGVKITGLPHLRTYIASADSMAWSYDARRKPPLPGCVGHKNCANCRVYAERWYARLPL